MHQALVYKRRCCWSHLLLFFMVFLANVVTDSQSHGQHFIPVVSGHVSAIALKSIALMQTPLLH